ncbi:hypothetical protein ACEN2J_02625 [Pseudorhodobacter sp. W20_MBD10_FR17]|uniref:hypothetical protein n=1 Tax=Pseudorhodobacter sp. W20_MBD10_FR17 TaxID=3240266 RepID=UPI003F960203
MSLITISNLGQLPVRRMLFLCAAALQIGCSLIFVTDVVIELNDFKFDVLLEAFAILGLAVGALEVTHKSCGKLIHPQDLVLLQKTLM